MIVDRYSSRLLGFCRQMLGSTEDAEDVLQEVFVNAYRAMLADTREINLRPWLYRIARNRCLNHLRKPTADAQESMDTVPCVDAASTHERVHNREEFRQLLADVKKLPETQRSALLLREMDAMSYEEIALAMDTTVPSIKSLLVRARISLAEASQARLLTCGEVRLELAEAAEGLLKVSGPVRRHVRDCDECSGFRNQVRVDAKVLAALSPIGPLIALKGLIASKLGFGTGASGAGAGAATAGGAGAGAAGAGSVTAGAFSAGGAAIGAGGAASGFGGAIGGAIGAKAVAGVVTAAVLTAGAVEVERTVWQSAAPPSGAKTASAQQVTPAPGPAPPAPAAKTAPIAAEPLVSENAATPIEPIAEEPAPAPVAEPVPDPEPVLVPVDEMAPTIEEELPPVLPAVEVTNVSGDLSADGTDAEDANVTTTVGADDGTHAVVKVDDPEPAGTPEESAPPPSSSSGQLSASAPASSVSSGQTHP